MLKKFQDKRVITLVTIIILIVLGIKYVFFTPSRFIIDVVWSIFWLSIFYLLYDKTHQDYKSLSCLVILLILHNLSLYNLGYLGLKFENLLHFIGGFTVAIVTDRLFNEKLTRFRRFIIVVIFALGFGAIHEIIEWIGFITLGLGEGMFFFGLGDFEPWKNTIVDLIFNGLGGTLMGLITVFRKKKNA